MHTDRIRHPGLRAKITSAEQAALLVQDGMTVTVEENGLVTVE